MARKIEPENPIDHKLDLGLVNFVAHPENPNYVVFRFGHKDRADGFEKMLNDANIWYERDEEMGRTRMFYVFGVHKSDFKSAQQINFLNEAHHKKPLIPFKAFRWGLILFSGLVMTIAIMGYCERNKKLQRINEQLQLEESINSNRK